VNKPKIKVRNATTFPTKLARRIARAVWDDRDVPRSGPGQEEEVAAPEELPACTCTSTNTTYKANPQGHDVGCARWGTNLANKHTPDGVFGVPPDQETP